MANQGSANIVLGGGCFWCLDAGYRQVLGVTAVVSGYAGGTWPDPTYERVLSGSTGHAEVVEVTFDPKIITLQDILNVFWTIHDPTTPNRQGHDVGTQYRSIILCLDDQQLIEAKKSRDAAQIVWEQPIVTEIALLETFYPAEDYHQDYFNKHPEAGYCQIIINPKLKHLREARAKLLKPL